MKDYSNLTDTELCLLATSSTEACEFLLRKYSPLVRKIARGYFLIGADEDDLIQEGMLGLYNAINTYNSDKSSFTTYCTNCVNNAMKDAVKSSNTKKNSPLNNSVSLHQSVADEEESPLIDLITTNVDSLEMVLQKEDYYGLINLIKTNFSQAELAVLKLYLQGLTYAEIAENLNITNKKVDNCIQKIKKRIKQLHF